MGKLVEKLKSGPLQVEIATGISIIAMALANKYWLNEPLSYLEMSIDALIIACFEVLARNPKTKNRWYTKPIIWTTAIILATVLIIVLNII